VGVKKLRSKLVSLSKGLRKRHTDAERLLWKHLRGKQLDGLKFRRQQPIGNYIVDFVCFENEVIIEVDGGQHAEEEMDRERDRCLEAEGFKMLRFWNHEVLLNLEGVLEVIRQNGGSHPPPAPPLKGGVRSRDGKLTRRGDL